MPENRIKAMRKEAGLSQKALGDMLGVGQATVSAWENGRTHPDNETLFKMSKIMGCSIGYLMGYETGVPYRGLSQEEWDKWLAQRFGVSDRRNDSQKKNENLTHTAEINDIFERLTEEERKRAVEVIRAMFS